MNRLRRFLSSMAGQIFLILLVGMSAAATVATTLVNAKRRQDLEQQNLSRSVDRLQDYVDLLNSNPGEMRTRLLEFGGPGIWMAASRHDTKGEDAAFQQALRQRDASLADARVRIADREACAPAIAAELRGMDRLPKRETPAEISHPHCRIVELTLDDGTALSLAVGTAPVMREQMAKIDPLFIAMLAGALALLAYVVARIASAPLQRLAQAASALGCDLQAAPIDPSGPTEVRAATTAFNAMQERMQMHLAERTQMLASITHDLQTPLTRLRLRLEDVDSEELRARLVGDLASMRALINEGLELARSAETSEQKVPLDLDSLLESLVDDAAETGADARFLGGCGAVLMLRPMAMQRVFGNLIQNAVNYGNAIRVRAERVDDGIVVTVQDDGPGLPEGSHKSVLSPFVRLETSRSRETGGTGLGLAIAQRLAEKDGAQLTLRNRTEGGLEAVVEWKSPVLAASETL